MHQNAPKNKINICSLKYSYLKYVTPSGLVDIFSAFPYNFKLYINTPEHS